MSGGDVGVVRSAVENHPAGGYHVAVGGVVRTMVGAQNIVLEDDLHVAVQFVDVALLLLLLGPDGNLLAGQRGGRSGGGGGRRQLTGKRQGSQQ